MPCAFGYAVAPPKTRPNISKAALTQRGWSTAVTPSRSTLGTNKTTRTRFSPPLRTGRRRAVLGRLFGTVRSISIVGRDHARHSDDTMREVQRVEVVAVQGSNLVPTESESAT